MNGRVFNLNAPGNPFLQAVYVLVGGLLLIGAVLMGAVILVAALGFLLLFGAIFWLRVWWLRRKMARSKRTDGTSSGHPGPGSGRVIEVEYTVVEEKTPSNDREDRGA